MMVGRNHNSNNSGPGTVSTLLWGGKTLRLYTYFVRASVPKTSSIFFLESGMRTSSSPLEDESIFPPLQCVIFPRFCHKTVLRPVWRVLTWIFCIQAFHIHLIYSLRIRSVKAFIIIPFILWRCEISPSKIIWRPERLIAKPFHSWQSRIPSPWWWIGTKAASSLCTWQWLDSGRIGTRWPGWSCLCGCKRRTPVWAAEEESVSQKLLWFSTILSSKATTNPTMFRKSVQGIL